MTFVLLLFISVAGHCSGSILSRIVKRHSFHLVCCYGGCGRFILEEYDQQQFNLVLLSFLVGERFLCTLARSSPCTMRGRGPSQALLFPARVRKPCILLDVASSACLTCLWLGGGNRKKSTAAILPPNPQGRGEVELGVQTATKQTLPGVINYPPGVIHCPLG